MFELDVLFDISSSGKTKFWKTWVQEYDNYSEISTHSGYLGYPGLVTTKKIYEGKNLNKINATTHYEQACSEAQSKWNEKIRKGSVLSANNLAQSDIKKLPMLAHKYKDKKKNVIFPVFLQPKLNGVRCYSTIANENVNMLSRGGKFFGGLDHIRSDLGLLFKAFPHLDFDGELFTKQLTFQEIVSAVKNEHKKVDNLELLEYHIYDVFDNNNPDADFSQRKEILDLLKEVLPPSIKVVPTEICYCEEDLLFFHKDYSRSYEGTMIRSFVGSYTHNHRSTSLLKLKDFLDSEYIIVGGYEGQGLSEKQAILTLQGPDDKTFNCRCRGPNSYREWQLENLESLIGKLLTVRYQALSDDSIPIFPVGISIRDYE